MHRDFKFAPARRFVNKNHGQFKSVQSQTGLKIFSPISLKYEVIIITLYFKVLLYNLNIAI